MLLTQDTSFTAYFRPTEQYELALESNDAERGSVYGAGMYAEGDTAKIWATAWRDYRFAHWNDGDTANPRWVVMTCDTSFTGIFLAQDGIEESANGQELRLVPNPASDHVVVSCGEVVEGVLVFTDLAGKEMGRYRMSGTDMKVDTQKLPAGGVLCDADYSAWHQHTGAGGRPFSLSRAQTSRLVCRDGKSLDGIER